MAQEDYYSNPDDDMSSESHDETKPHDDKEEDYGETALLPKTILAGKEFDVGDEVVLKIVHKYKDEVEVAYATEPEKKKGEEKDIGEPEDMAAAQDQLSAMAT